MFQYVLKALEEKIQDQTIVKFQVFNTAHPTQKLPRIWFKHHLLKLYYDMKLGLGYEGPYMTK